MRPRSRARSSSASKGLRRPGHRSRPHVVPLGVPGLFHGRRGSRLAAHSRHRAGATTLEELEGDRSAKPFVVGAPHDPHAAAPQHPQEPVASGDRFGLHRRLPRLFAVHRGRDGIHGPTFDSHEVRVVGSQLGIDGSTRRADMVLRVGAAAQARFDLRHSEAPRSGPALRRIDW